MSNDQTLDTIGKKLSELLPRDAVHIATYAAVAGETLIASEHITITDFTARTARVAMNLNDAIGIVDPFITEAIKEGEMFWVFIYPRTITSLKHEWSHPSIDKSESHARETAVLQVRERLLGDSKAWLEEYLETNVGISLSTFLYALSYDDLRDEYIVISGEDANGRMTEEFWDHVEVVTNQKYPDRPTYFSCAC